MVLVCLGGAIIPHPRCNCNRQMSTGSLSFLGQGYAQGLSHPACDSNHASIRVKQGVAAREGLHLHNFDNHVFGNALGAEPCFNMFH